MRNWLGQDIRAGNTVYRGARDGNSSSFRLGVVESVNTAKRTARVAWQFEDGWYWSPDRVSFTVPQKMNSTGSPSVDSLVVVDFDVLDAVQSTYAVVHDAKQRRLDADEFERVTRIERNA